MRQIYTDYETEKMIKTIRDKEPDFNLSSFFKKHILNYLQSGGDENEDVIKKDLEDLQRSKDQLKSDEIFLKNKLAKLQKEKKETEKKEMKEKQKETERKKKREESVSEWIKELYGIKDKKKIDILTKECVDMMLKGQANNLLDYMERIKKYKPLNDRKKNKS